MAYDDKEMLRDYNGVVIPTQFYNPSTGEFELDSSISATAAIVATLATESTLTATAASLSGISAAGAVGTLTATTTATAAIAGVSALAGRKGLEILNNSANIVYWGYSNSVTTADGIPINPGIAKQFQFNPSVATPIYVIAGSDSSLYIHEWK